MKEINFLYGTAWKEDRTEKCVLKALENGFRGIDTANQRKHYFEEGVGEALQKAYPRFNIEREDLFLQTKFSPLNAQDDRLPYDPEASPGHQVQQSLENSLEHLNTDYLDSYVLHGPSMMMGLGKADWFTWETFEKLFVSGKVKSIGVSNMSLEQVKELVENAEIPPHCVQNRCFAKTGWDRDVREYCQEQGIIYQGFSLLTANPEVFEHPKFLETLKEKDLTPAQLIFAFALKANILPLTGTTDPSHMQEDLNCTGVELEDHHFRTLERLIA